MKTIYQLAKLNQRSGFTLSLQQWQTIVRAARRLSKWCVLECNGNAYRDDQTDKVYYYSNGVSYPCRDYETAALKRIAQVCGKSNLYYYYQSDPRGMQIYLSTVPLDGKNYTKGYGVIIQ